MAGASSRGKGQGITFLQLNRRERHARDRPALTHWIAEPIAAAYGTLRIMTKRKHLSQKAGQPKPPIRNARKSTNNSWTSPAKIERVERQKLALDFRKQGYSYSQIADELKCSAPTAYELVIEALKAIIQEPAEQVLALELDRVDTLLAGLYAEAATGDDIKVRTTLSVLERRDKLLGITQKQTIEVSGPNGGPVETKDVTDTQRAKALAVLIAKVKAQAAKKGD